MSKRWLMWWGALLTARAALVILMLSGCVRTQTTETGSARGSLNGQPVAIEWQRDADGHTSLTVPPIISGAAGLLPAPWGDLASLVLALVAGGGAVAAKTQASRANEHKADAAEGWSKFEALATKGDA